MPRRVSNEGCRTFEIVNHLSFYPFADSKLDSKSNLHILNELAELNNCNVSVLGWSAEFV